MTRRAGILAPVSTLGGAHGIGDFGKSAYEFVDLIKKRKIGIDSSEKYHSL